MAAKRPMPKEREASRMDMKEDAKEEAVRLGKQHMAVAANKARENLAKGQDARVMQQTGAALKKFVTPFDTVIAALKRGKK